MGVPEGPLTSVRGETPSPVGGAPLGSRSATRGGRGAQTGMEDGRDVCSKRGATRQGPFRWVTRWGCLLKGTPFCDHPPEDTRWEARWGGHHKAPPPATGSETGSLYQLLGCSPRCRPDTSLMYPPTCSGQKVPQQTQKWRFRPWVRTIYYGKCQSTYKPIKVFPYKMASGTAPKNFSAEIQSPHRPPTGRTSHQLDKARGCLAQSPPEHPP